MAIRVHEVLMDQFIASWDAPPDELILRSIAIKKGASCMAIMGSIERHDVRYMVGIIQAPLARVQQRFAVSGEKQREFTPFTYAAATWQHRRHIIAKLEVTDKGPNPRFLVTNLEGNP